MESSRYEITLPLVGEGGNLLSTVPPKKTFKTVETPYTEAVLSW